MEIQIPSLLLCISFLFFTLILLKFGSKQKSNAKFPPGPWKLPLIGNIHNLVGDVPHRALHQLAQKFGPMMGLQLGELSVVVISSADAAKQIMKTHDINFASRPPIIAAEIISYGCTSITFSPHSDYWRQLRKLCTLELLSNKRVQSFRSLREKVFADLSRWIASMEGSSINLTAELYNSTYALISRATLGDHTTEHEALLPILKEVIEISAGFDIAELFPSVKVLQGVSGLRRRIMVLHKEADKILEDVVRQHRGVKVEEHEDLLDVLLRVEEEGLELPLTTDNIKSVLVDMLGAGSETSATTMDWVMAEMLKNPRVLEKAQEEVRKVFDEEGFVDESRIPQLKYMKAVVKETLRMHPPLPLLLPRKCGETCEVNGYEIRAETKIIVNAWAVNRDPKCWEDAHSFKPERFMDNMVDYRGNHFEYIPFGAGRRMCPGMTFGLANVELPLAMFLYHFDWKLGGGMKPQEMDMADGTGVTSRRIKDLCVVPVIKRPLPIN
ncbi:salviol synthase-like [Salvia miltiorrhiza]|uniref:salviol synthase-like n=1 Tax=Salvia miltiorrhiza TaxID=226208 RepID=UPI0025ACDF53|nr:salviol synthase-like [Salvia miltiorrhiza]